MGSRRSKRLSEKTVFKANGGRFVIKEAIDLVDGKRIKKIFRWYGNGGGGGSVVVIPVLDDNTLLLIRNYRPPMRERAGSQNDGWVYELPGGKIENGEKVTHAAGRELEEEIGYKARRVRYLYKTLIAPWMANSVNYVCVATDLEKTKAMLEDNEAIEVVKMNVNRIKKLLKEKEGILQDTGTREAILYWLYHFNGRKGI